MTFVFFCFTSGEDDMTFDNVFSSLRNVYFKKLGDSLSLIFVDDFDDGLRFSPDGDNCFFFRFHESRKAFISSKTNPKCFNHSCNRSSLKLEGKV